MSGIAAVWRLDGAPLHRATLDRVTERLAPRIADAVGAWLDGPVGLAHRMLLDQVATFHQGIRRLPGGHSLTVGAGGTSSAERART